MKTKKLLSLFLLTLLCSIGTSALADTELFSANFKSWEAGTITAGSTQNGVYFKSAVTVSSDKGITFAGNASTSSNYIAIPLSNVNGSITITVTHESKRPQWKHAVVGVDALPATISNPSSVADNTRPSSNTSTSSWSVDVNKSYAILYIGKGSNGVSDMYSIAITTPASSGKASLTGEWTNAAPSFEIGSVATIPTFSVTGGTLGTDYSIAYSKTDASGIVTLTDGTGAISAINTSAAASATVKATVTVINTTYYEMETTEYDCVITVAELWAAPTFGDWGAYDASIESYPITITAAEGATIKYTITGGSQQTAATNPVTVNVGYGKTITAIATGGVKGNSAEASKTAAGKPSVEKPTLSIGSYNYAEGGYPVTATCATEGATLTYKIGSGAATACTAGVPFYAIGGNVTVTGAKTGWTSVNSDALKLNAAPSSTSPETCIPFQTGADSYDKDKDHVYVSCVIPSAYIAGLNGGDGLKLRTNVATDIDDVKGLQINVNKGYKITKVVFSGRSNGSNAISVSKCYVDGEEITFSATTLPASSGSFNDITVDEISATSHVVFQLGIEQSQYRGNISVTYARLTEAISTADGQTYGTHVTAHDLDFADVSGISAYKITGVENGVIQTGDALTEVPSGTPILIETTSAGATVNVPYASSTPAAISGNKLKVGTTGVVSEETIYRYVLAVQGGKTGFYKLTSPTDVQATKAYLELTDSEAAQAPTFVRLVDDENNATNLENIESTDKAVKFIENGQLLIKRDGVVYDALGRIVK